jgi:hypothetical protein
MQLYRFMLLCSSYYGNKGVSSLVSDVDQYIIQKLLDFILTYIWYSYVCGEIWTYCTYTGLFFPKVAYPGS